jgi:hypothetical protein
LIDLLSSNSNLFDSTSLKKMRTQIQTLLLFAPALVAAQRGGQQSSQASNGGGSSGPAPSNAAPSSAASQPSVILSTSFVTQVGLTIHDGVRETATFTSPVVITITPNAPPPSGAPPASGGGSGAASQSSTSTKPLPVGPTTFMAGGGGGTAPAPAPGVTQNGVKYGPDDGYIAGARETMSKSLVAALLGLGVMIGVNLLPMA